jgi:hypothetical protein
VETHRCLVTPEGAYPHPGVYRATDDLRVAHLRLAQKGLPPHKPKQGNLPQAPPAEEESEIEQVPLPLDRIMAMTTYEAGQRGNAPEAVQETGVPPTARDPLRGPKDPQ